MAGRNAEELQRGTKTLRGGYVHYLDCGIVLKSVKAHMSYICQNCTLQIFIPSLTSVIPQ